jgi:hypothetical protein
MVLTFTLQSAYSGATYVAGPFDISGTTSGGITTLLGDNISKANLLNGVTISNIDDATTGGTIQSVDGICSNSISWTVTGDEPTSSGCLCYSIEVPKDLLTNNGEILFLSYVNCAGANILLDTSNTVNVDSGTTQIYSVCASISPSLVKYGSGDLENAPLEITYTQGESCESDAGCQPFI